MGARGLMRGLFTLALVGCGPLDPELGAERDAEVNPPASFALVRDQVFRPRCSCHVVADGIGRTRGGLDLDDYDAVRAGGRNSAGTAVVPGSPESSVIIQKIGDAPPFGARMPRGAFRLDDRSRQILTDWIAAGAPQ